MSFGMLKFGEKCDRHPQPKFRGQDERSHIFAPPKPQVEATKMQASGDWFKPPPKAGEGPAPRPLTATQRAAVRQMSTTGGLAAMISRPLATPEVGVTKKTEIDVTGIPGRKRPSTASSNPLGLPDEVSPSHQNNKEQTAAPQKQPSGPHISQKQKDQIQMAKNIQAGLVMPTNLPLPVNMNEVVGKIEQPKNFVPPAKEMSGVESLQRQLQMETQLDAHVQTIRKYIEVKSNFAPPQGQNQCLAKILKGHCTAQGNEMKVEDFSTAIAIFNLGLTEDEREALFDRFDANENGTLSFREVSEGLLGQGKKKVAAANGEARALLADLKMKILKRNPGTNSVRSFTRSFRLLNKDKSADGLTSDELFNGLQKIGLRVPLASVQKLVTFFDSGNDGKVSQTEFMTALRGRMSVRRKKLVLKAYSILDKNGDGNVTLEELGQSYDTTNHPQVKSGEKTAEQVLGDFADSWDQSGDDVISQKEFLTYYKDISSGIELDDYFELMIRNAWHIPGGEGVCANTANRRVLVIHNDGSQSVEMLEQDLGIGPKDLAKMRAQLEKQGITDIKAIELAG